MTNPPSTPSEWLAFAANLAARYPLTPITPVGEDLQRALIAYLRDGGASGADLLDIRADFVAILPRFFNALVQAGQNGDVHGEQFVGLIEMLFQQIVDEADELAARQAHERKH